MGSANGQFYTCARTFHQLNSKQCYKALHQSITSKKENIHVTKYAMHFS
jgi:hypothetical protein